MAREYTFIFPRELSELEIEALCSRVFKPAGTQDADAIFKLALETEKYLHSEEHRKQMLLERIEKVEAESEQEEAKPETIQDHETEAARAAREDRERQERIDRMREETKRLSRKADIKSAIALGLSIAAIVLRIILTVK